MRCLISDTYKENERHNLNRKYKTTAKISAKHCDKFACDEIELDLFALNFIT